MVSLAECVDCFSENALEVIVVLVCDGLQKLHSSTREMLDRQGKCEIPMNKGDITNSILEIPNIDLDKYKIICEDDHLHRTFERFQTIKFVVIIKETNKGKADSHELFFNFVNRISSTYVFLTDAGTTFKYDCLLVLINALEKKKKLVGATGRQRAASASQMGISFWKWLFSPIPLQAFEFEWTSTTNMAPFTLFGSLPVMPGPCQMFHWKRLEEKSKEKKTNPIKDYIDICKQADDPETSSFECKQQAKLAEDRLLVALVVGGTGLRTEWIPGATFYYTAESGFRRLLEQRRRWINGATYVYFWLLTKGGEKQLLKDGQIENKKILQFLWNMQILQYYTCLLSPAFFSICLRESVAFLLVQYPLLSTIFPEVNYGLNTDYIFSGGADFPCYGFLLLVILWSLIAHFIKKPGELNLFINCLSWVYLIMSAVVMMVILFGFFLSLQHSQSQNTFGSKTNQFIVLMVWVIQFVLSIAFSLNAAIRSICMLPLFLLGQCFYVCFIPSYALARLYSILWGTNADKITSVPQNHQNQSEILDPLSANLLQQDVEAQRGNEEDDLRAKEQARKARKLIESKLMRFCRRRYIPFLILNIVVVILLRYLMTEDKEATVWIVTTVVFAPTLPNTLLTFILVVKSFVEWLKGTLSENEGEENHKEERVRRLTFGDQRARHSRSLGSRSIGNSIS
eukprot:c8115_g1_i1.p1 GENE.c8115_g1_i1~~c8115_g1_i1.p1  ORF type:complete len:750 (-),score=155.03 c8115_g1_i1:276-2327(-)